MKSYIQVQNISVESHFQSEDRSEANPEEAEVVVQTATKREEVQKSDEDGPDVFPSLLWIL
jgi:hypothetical protein